MIILQPHQQVTPLYFLVFMAQTMDASIKITKNIPGGVLDLF